MLKVHGLSVMLLSNKCRGPYSGDMMYDAWLTFWQINSLTVIFYLIMLTSIPAEPSHTVSASCWLERKCQDRSKCGWNTLNIRFVFGTRRRKSVRYILSATSQFGENTTDGKMHIFFMQILGYLHENLPPTEWNPNYCHCRTPCSSCLHPSPLLLFLCVRLTSGCLSDARCSYFSCSSLTPNLMPFNRCKSWASLSS